MSEKKIQCSFEAVIQKLQTLRGGDGRYRLTLDIPLIYAKEMSKMFSMDEYTTIAVGIVEKPQEIISELSEKPPTERKVVKTRSYR